MKLFGSFLFLASLIGFLFFPISTALACDLTNDESPLGTNKCVVRQKTAPPATAPAPIAQAANLAYGASPNDARDFVDSWQTLPPNASVWYKTSDSLGYRLIELSIEASPANAIGLSMFSPDQREGLSADTKPIGRGSSNKYDPPNVLHWKAGYARSGVWYALVINYSAAPVSYRLIYNQADQTQKNCTGYWEYIGKDYVYWIDCNRDGKPNP